MGIYIKDGSYYVRLQVCGKDIRERVGKVSPANKTKATALLRELKNKALVYQAQGNGSQIIRDLEQAKEKRSFQELANEFMAERADLKNSTMTQYRSMLKQYLLPAFGDKDLKLINEAMVAQWQSELSKRLAPARTNTIVQMFRTMMAIAARRKYIVEDPTKNVKRRQEPAPDVDPLSDDELRLALAAVDEHYRPLFVTLAFTGARPNELQALRWTDLDWQRNEIRINKGMVRGVEGLPKTKSAHRQLPMLDPVVAALKSLQQRPVRSVDDFIFVDKKGLPVKKHLDRIWARALRKAGLRHRASYQLRHTFASQALAKGLAPGYVAKLLGHSGLEILYRHYARWINDATKQQEQLLKSSFVLSTFEVDANGIKQKSAESKVGTNPGTISFVG